MQKLKNLSFYQKLLLGGVLLIVLVFSLIPDKADKPIGDNQNTYEMNQDAAPAPGFTGIPNPVSNDRNQRVVIVDHGLQMQMASIEVPPGWNLLQDISLNLYTGQYDRFRSDLIGPNGQFIRTLNIAQYSQWEGTNFEQTWRSMVMNGLSGAIDNIRLSNLQPSPTMENDQQYREGVQKLRQQGMQVQALEVPFSGQRNAGTYRGVAYIAHATIPQSPGNMGVLIGKIVGSPEHLFEETLMIDKKVSASHQQNPQYDMRVAQIHQQVAQRRQQEMAEMNRSHQQRMQDMRQGFDAQNRQWSENFFGSWNTGSSTTGSGYSSNDQFLDAITGYSTFDDPQTGYQRRIEGHYQYNFTDGMGNYYGTNDPNFDYGVLGNSWRPIDPLRPNN